MKILSGINLSYQNNIQINSPKTKTQARTNSVELRAVPMPSGINFKSAVTNGQFLRRLSGIHDPYSEIVLLNNKEMHQANTDLESMNKSCQRIKYLEAYTENMFPVERNVFEMCKSELKKDKSLSLQQILQSKSEKAQKNLNKSQLEILEKIKENTDELSEVNKMRVLHLVGKSESALQNTDEDGFKRGAFLNELVYLSQYENVSELEKKIKELSEPAKTDEMKELGKIADILNKNPYYYYRDGEDIYGLITNMQKKHMPEAVGKSNELQTIIELAETLPTPKDSVDAYIVNMKDKADITIAKGFISGALATIEHIVPESKGGLNSASNFILVSKSRNEERSSMSLSKFVKKYPKIPSYCKQYLKDITNAAEHNKLNSHLWYPYVIKDTLNEELGTNLNVNGYKISPEKAFKNFLYKNEEQYSQYQEYFS